MICDCKNYGPAVSQNEVVSTLASSMSDGIVVPSIFKCARPIV